MFALPPAPPLTLAPDWDLYDDHLRLLFPLLGAGALQELTTQAEYRFVAPTTVWQSTPGGVICPASTATGDGFTPGPDYGMDNLSEFSFSWWVYGDVIAAAAGTLASTRDGSNGGLSVGLAAASAGRGRPEVTFHGVTTYRPATSDIVARQWNHCGITWDSAVPEAAFYVNGALVDRVATAATVRNTGAGLKLYQTGPQSFTGSQGWPYHAHSLCGWDRKLDQSEMWSLYNGATSADMYLDDEPEVLIAEIGAPPGDFGPHMIKNFGFGGGLGA